MDNHKRDILIQLQKDLAKELYFNTNTNTEKTYSPETYNLFEDIFLHEELFGQKENKNPFEENTQQKLTETNFNEYWSDENFHCLGIISDKLGIDLLFLRDFYDTMGHTPLFLDLEFIRSFEMFHVELEDKLFALETATEFKWDLEIDIDNQTILTDTVMIYFLKSNDWDETREFLLKEFQQQEVKELIDRLDKWEEERLGKRDG